jgi:hypothetical protein
MLAAYHGHAELVKLLLDHGADPNRLNDRGQSPLAGAVFKMEDAVIEVHPHQVCEAASSALTIGHRSFSRAGRTQITELRRH